jgi:hypothetical protein
VTPLKREVLFFALNEISHSLGFAQSAARRFATDLDALETGSTTAVSIAFIKNRLSDAKESLVAAEGEIGSLIRATGVE